MSPIALRHFRLYFGILVCLAVALMAKAVPHAVHPSWLALCAVWVLMLLGEASPVPMPSGGYVTPTAVIDLACIVFLGPFYTALLDVSSTFVMQAVVQRKPMIRVVHNMAVFAIATLAAGAAYSAAGGVTGHFSASHDMVPMLIAGLVYFVVDSVLISTVLGLTGDTSPWRVWQRNFQPGILLHLFSVTLGALAALTYANSGWVGLVLLAVPFIVSGRMLRLYTEIRSDLKDFVRALSEVLEEVDPYTRHHSTRVAQYSVCLARGMGLSERDVEEIELAALVHDLGKIGPHHQQIVQKAGRLTDAEYQALQAHPAVGAEIVARVRTLRQAADIVLGHHEQPDGHGYPRGLQGPDISMGARIVHVCDSFDAMTSDRPYRRALSVAAALAELESGAGTQFDDGVVECLKRMHAAGTFEVSPSLSSEALQLLIMPLESQPPHVAPGLAIPHAA